MKRGPKGMGRLKCQKTEPLGALCNADLVTVVNTISDVGFQVHYG